MINFGIRPHYQVAAGANIRDDTNAVFRTLKALLTGTPDHQ